MRIDHYRTASGKVIYQDWLDSIRDQMTRARITAKVDRYAQDRTGDSKALGMGLHELRLHFGPGYRVYFAVIGNVVLLLLAGGHKGTQKHDIAKAHEYLQDYVERRKA